jgi:putative SOS response-associated peptidase YedK
MTVSPQDRPRPLGFRARLGEGHQHRQPDDQRPRRVRAQQRRLQGRVQAAACDLPADGFYEWKKLPARRGEQPYYLERRDGEPIALAGLWDEWRGPDRKGEPLRTVTIITTTPNKTMKRIHDRMPVILPPSAWDTWLGPDNDDTEALAKLLVPAPDDLLVARPVSTAVNSVRNDGPELTDEATGDQPVG